MRSNAAFAASLLALTTIAVAQHGPGEHAGSPPEKLGTVEFANSCTAAAQKPLVEAVALLHSFWYEEARRRFRTAAERDPDCAIAWWGVAMTCWQPLWEPRGPGLDLLHEGAEAIERARALGGTARERDYVAALHAFYADMDRTDHLERVLAYERAMERLAERHPRDVEATVFYALALLGSATSLPPDKTHARQLRAGELLQPVARMHPDHPGAVHYIIHACDYPGLAQHALEAARRYARIAPDAPHALHMPSHIFTRLGLWDESIASNRNAAESARRHGIVGEQLHAMDYMVFAYLQQGRDRDAHELMQSMPPIRPGAPHYFAGVFAHAAIPARYAIERRAWEEAAALVVPPGLPGGRYAWADATIVFARALGAARTGRLQQSRDDLGKLAALHEVLRAHQEEYWATQAEIQRRAATAWLAFAEGRADEALTLMRSAAELEDSTDKLPVTPGRIVPARDLLGQMLLAQNRPREAAGEFARVLEAEPGRFGALQGAACASELTGDTERARALYDALARLASGSDRPPGSARRTPSSGAWDCRCPTAEGAPPMGRCPRTQ